MNFEDINLLHYTVEKYKLEIGLLNELYDLFLIIEECKKARLEIIASHQQLISPKFNIENMKTHQNILINLIKKYTNE